jgi:heme exporter protein CcmD
MQDSHAGYIIAAYIVTAVTLSAMILSIFVDHRSLVRALARFAARDGETRNGARRS